MSTTGRGDQINSVFFQSNDLQSWYLSIPSIAIGMTRIGKWLIWFSIRKICGSGISAHGGITGHHYNTVGTCALSQAGTSPDITLDVAVVKISQQTSKSVFASDSFPSVPRFHPRTTWSVRAPKAHIWRLTLQSEEHCYISRRWKGPISLTAVGVCVGVWVCGCVGVWVCGAWTVWTLAIWTWLRISIDLALFRVGLLMKSEHLGPNKCTHDWMLSTYG